MSFQNVPNYLDILQIPGFLYWNPTGFATENDWGTLVGFSQTGLNVFAGYNVVVLPGEERGNEPIYKFYTGGSPKCGIHLINWNDTTIQLLFPGLWAAGKKLQFPNNYPAGRNLLDLAKPLVYVPSDRTSNPIFLAQKAAPSVSGTYKFSRQGITQFALSFDLFRKTNDVDGLLYVGAIGGAVLR